MHFNGEAHASKSSVIILKGFHELLSCKQWQPGWDYVVSFS